MLLLIAALIGGAILRFTGLGTAEMSADEGASWAAAAAPNLAGVIKIQAEVNAGKLAVHEIALHGWIRCFGEGIFAMRSLSALLGTIAILLVFWVARELLQGPGDAGAGETRAQASAVFTALIFAASLVMIKYARELRMYPLMLDLLIAQVACFVRASRRGGLYAYIGAGGLAVLAVATNLSALLVPAAEGIWILIMFARSGIRAATPESGRAWRLVLALAIAAAIFFPLLFVEWRTGSAAVGRGVLRWIGRPPLWEPIALFNKGIGTFAFPVVAALAIYGAIRGWREAHDAVAFSLIWMWAPVVAMTILSYTLTPILVERYVLSCFVPLFFLAALGIASLTSSHARAAAIVLVLALSVGHVWSHARKPHDTQWHEAAAIALKNLPDSKTLSVRPAYAIEVVRYYLPPTARSRAQRDGNATILLVQQTAHDTERHKMIRRDYPILIARLRGVTVLKR